MVTSFQLAGCRWEVLLTPDLSEMGNCNPETHIIKIRADLSKQAQQATLYHELVHAILFTMGQINHNEEFVDTFGGFLHQYDKTKQ